MGSTAQRWLGTWRLKVPFILGSFAAAGLVAAGVVSGADQPSISSDQSDYAPGDAVALSGAGWQAGEAVQVLVDDDQNDPWSHEAELTAAPDGAVSDSFVLPTGLAGTFTVTATAPSGSATASFTVTAPPSSPPQVPTVSSDESTYTPGATVQLTGANWTPGSAVHVVVDDDKSDPWTHVADLTADSAGAISDSFSLPPVLTGNFTVTATATPEMTATDSFSVAPLGEPTIVSDKSSYPPGATVQLTGANWTPGSAVHIVVDDDESDPWSHTADVVAGIDGAVSDSFSLPSGLAATFTATATGTLGQSATASFTVVQPQPKISADKDDYSPGDTVVLTGTGWASGESVHIVIDDVEGQSWTREADVTAASDGTFTDTFVLPDQFVATYTVTATGPVSGTVTASFRDSLSGYYEGTTAVGTCTNPGNVLVSDDVRATCATGQNVVVSGFGLDSIVPSTAANIMLNVEVEANRTGGAQNAAVSLSFNGTSFTAATNTNNFGPSDGIQTVPTASATSCQSFGRTWSWSELSDSNFRVRVQANANTLNIDRVRVRACWNGSNVMRASVAGGSTAVASPSATLRVAVEVNHSGPDPNDNWRCTKVQIEGQTAVDANHGNHDSAGIDDEGFNVTVPSTRGTYDISFTPYQNDGCTLPAAAETFTLPDAITVGIFGDSFGIIGQNTYTANSWTDGDAGGSTCAVSINGTYGDGFLDDSGHLRLRQGCTQTRSAISTSGFANVHLEYAWGNDGSPGSLVVEWKPSTSGTWNTLATHTFASGGFVAPTTAADFSLGSGATNTNIDIRFTGSTASSSRHALVDNVIVTGDPQNTITFNQTGIPGTDAGATNVLSVTIDSTTTNYNAADFPVVRTVTSGTVVSFTYNTPVASSTTGKQYAKTAGPTPGSPVTVTSNTTVSATYTQQYRLTLATNPAGVGTTNVTGGTDGTFYNEGTVLSLTAATPVLFNSGNSRYVFSSWSGDATGTANPVSVTMSAPRSVTANYNTQHKLTLATNPAAVGLSNVTGGTDGTFYNEGTVLSLTAATPVLFNSGNSRYVFSSWSGDATGTANPVSVTMSAPRSVTANYNTQHKLTLATNPAAVGLSNVTGGTDGTFYNEGTVLSLTAATPVLFNSGNSRYVFSSWSGDATGTANPVSVTMSAPRSVTANYNTQHKLTLATNPAAVGLSNVTGGTDGTFYNEGTVLSLTAATPVLFNSGNSRYVFSSWSGDATGTANPVSVTMSAPRSVTANYNTQHKLTLATNPAAVGLSNVTGGTDGTFYNEGTVLSLTAATHVAAGPGSRYEFRNWTGDVMSPPNASNPVTVTVNAPKSVTANYVTQFEITVAQSGIGGDTTATVVTVDGADKARADLPFSKWVDAGDSVSYDYKSPVASTTAGKRYVLTTPAPTPASPFTVSGAATVTGTYKVQFEITVAQSGIGGDTTATVVTVDGADKARADLPFSKWVDAGDSVSYDYKSPVASTTAGKRYVLTTPAPTPASPFTVSGAATVTGTYKVQFEITVAQSGIGGDTTATVVTVDGADKARADLPFSKWVDAGDSVSYDYKSPVASTTAGKRYVLTTPAPTPASPFTVSGAATVTGTYKVQFEITVAQSGIGGDTTATVVTVDGADKARADLPFSKWVDAGDSVSYDYKSPVASTTAGKRYVLTTPAPTPASPFTVSGAATVTGTYKVQFEITVAQSGIGGDTTATVVTVDGADKARADLPFSKWVDAGDSVSYDYKSPVASTTAGKRYVLTTPAPTPASPFTVSGAATVTGTYKVQFEITVAQSGIGGDTTATVVTVDGADKARADLPFSKWVDAGDSVSYDYKSPVASTTAGKRYVLTTPAPTPASPFTVSGAATVTGTYKVQFEITVAQSGIGGDTTATVVTVDGADKARADLPFSKWVDAGDSVSYDYKSPVASTTAGKRYVLTTPAPTPASPFTVSGAATVTGTYKVQFEITVAQSGIGGDTTATVVTVDGADKARADLPFSKWVDAGDSVSYDYKSPVASTTAGKRYVLTTPAPTPASPFTVSGAATVTGTYKVQFEITVAQSGIGGDTTATVVTVDGADKARADLPFSKWVDAGDSVSYDYKSPVASTTAGKRYVLTTPAPTPASPFTVSGAATVTGTYKVQFEITVAQSGIGGDTTATVVTVDGADKARADLPFSKWVDAGDSVSYDYKSPVASTTAGKRYVLTTPAPTPASPFTVSGAATVTGTYKVQFEITVAQSGIGGDTTATVVTVDGADKARADLPFSKWVDAGDSVSYDYKSPVASTTAGKRYVLTTPAPTPASPFTVSGAATVTGTYKVQFEITVAQSGIGGDTTATVVTVDGADKARADLPFSKWVDAGDSVSYDYKSPVASTTAGKRYVLTTPAPTPASPFTVSGAATVTGTYKVQFEITVAQSGIGGDTTATVVTVDGADKARADLPFSKWVDAGDSVSYDYKSPVASTTAGKRYVLTTPAPTPASPFTVSGAATVTGTYKVQFEITVAQSGIGGDTTATVVTVDGADKARADLPFSKWVDAGDSVSYDYKSPVASTTAGKRYVLTTPAPTPASPFTVSGAATVTGTYKVQYRVRYDQAGITLATGSNTIVTVDGVSKVKTELPFDKWYDPGSTSTYAYSSPVYTQPASATQYTLTSVTGPASPITVVAPTTVTGNYATNTYSIQYMRPLDQTTDGSIVNTGKNGRVVPVKVDLFRNGVKLNETTVGGDVTVKVIGATCGASAAADPVEEYADAGNSNGNTNLFRWDGDGWIYNLDTTGLGLQVGKCYRIDVYIGGTSAVRASASIYALFKPVK